MFLIGAPAFDEEKTYIFDGIIVRHGCKGKNDIKGTCPATLFDTKIISENMEHFASFIVCTLLLLNVYGTEGHSSKRCKRVVDLQGYTKVNAAHGHWPQDGFCQVAYLRDGSTSSYQLSVDMYNFIGWRGVNSGHPGVLLNAEDEDNYDFVYFRFVAIYTRVRGKMSLFWFQT